MIPTKLRSVLAPALGALLLAGCAAEYEGLTDLDDTPGGDLMARYVSLGNSITTGLQSAGLTDSLQMLAYPVLVAAQAQVPFVVPLVADPGCVPPYETSSLVSTRRVGGADPSGCFLRDERVLQTRPIQNVAYPGSYIAGAIDLTVPANPASANVYKTLLLGGRSQVQAMADANPTFVSVWLGNNETLASAVAGVVVPGVPGLLATQASFEASLDSIVRAIKNTRAQGAALIAPVNALAFAPRVQPGAFFFIARAGGGIPKPVGLSCAPGTPGGRAFVALDAISDPSFGTIECNEGSPYVTSLAEQASYTATVNGYKNAVKARADQNGWIYIDPDARFAADLADPAKNRKCQGLATAATQAQLQIAVGTTCPSAAAPFFGSWISFDATHPSSIAHRAFANALISAINTKHSKSIPLLTN